MTFPDRRGLTVVLAWDARVDLDLYVTDPTWETVYFANNPSRSGAKLIKDVGCNDVATHAGPFEEIVHIADPAPGGYRIGVDFIDTCTGKIDQAAFRVAAVMHGGAPQEKTGAIQLEHFLPRVAEYRLSGDTLLPADFTESGRIERALPANSNCADTAAQSTYPPNSLPCKGRGNRSSSLSLAGKGAGGIGPPRRRPGELVE